MKALTVPIAIVAALLPTLVGAAAAQPAWLVGSWTAVYDEDGSPADIMEFSADGRFINYGVKCNLVDEHRFHTFNDEVYVTIEIPRKGPIALVFRPSADKKQLTYTSPRTRRNAVYERLKSNPCLKKV